MDVLMLPEKKVMFDCEYAAPSVSTKKFVAYIYEATKKEIMNALTNPGPIVVYNELTGAHTYKGYATVEEIRTQENGYIAILSPMKKKAETQDVNQDDKQTDV